jgi:hypothetical protein
LPRKKPKNPPLAFTVREGVVVVTLGGLMVVVVVVDVVVKDC